jgi:hypothetical protein
VLANLGEHVVGQTDQVEPVRYDNGVREGVGDRAQVGRGQVDGHVCDSGPPRIRLRLEPFRDSGGGASVDVGEQAGGAVGIDDTGVPPVGSDAPLPGVGVLFPLELAAAGLIDTQYAYPWRRLRQQLVDVGDVRPVRHRPGHPVVLRPRQHAGEPLGYRRAALSPQPRREPGSCRDGWQRLGEGLARAPLFATPPPPLVPHQPHRRRTVGDVSRMRGGVALQRGGEHPTRWARRRRLVGGDHVRHPAALDLQVDPLDPEPLDPQQQRRPALHRVQDVFDMRRLDQARDLTFVIMNCLDNSHDHRGHGPLSSGQESRARPVKFEEPV